MQAQLQDHNAKRPRSEDGEVAVSRDREANDIVKMVYLDIRDGTFVTVIEENGDGRPVTIHVKQTGHNEDDVLSIRGRRLGGDRDEFWHVNPVTDRWRLGKPRLPSRGA